MILALVCTSRETEYRETTPDDALSMKKENNMHAHTHTPAQSSQLFNLPICQPICQPAIQPDSQSASHPATQPTTILASSHAYLQARPRSTQAHTAYNAHNAARHNTTQHSTAQHRAPSVGENQSGIPPPCGGPKGPRRVRRTHLGLFWGASLCALPGAEFRSLPRTTQHSTAQHSTTQHTFNEGEPIVLGALFVRCPELRIGQSYAQRNTLQRCTTQPCVCVF